MEKLGCSADVMYICRGGFYRVDQTGFLIYSDMVFDSLGEAPRSCNTTGFVIGGTGCVDQRGVNDYGLLHGHFPLLELGLDCFKNFLAEVMLLKQVS